AYAGTFVYGKTRTQVPLGGGRPQQRRLPLSEWEGDRARPVPSLRDVGDVYAHSGYVGRQLCLLCAQPAPWGAAPRGNVAPRHRLLWELWAQDDGAVQRGESVSLYLSAIAGARAGVSTAPRRPCRPTGRRGLFRRLGPSGTRP